MAKIYQLKITLRDSKPPIWRRVLVDGSINLLELHDIIQIAMGWTDSHLHQFIIDEEYYSMPDPYAMRSLKDERRFRLNQIAPQEKIIFIYEYDFGDSWEHKILVEKISAPEPRTSYPICIKGKRACPPEDVGGIWGYEAFLEAMGNSDNPRHQDIMEWWGDSFDPESFSLEEVNLELQDLKK
jgi:hypothetical protein